MRLATGYNEILPMSDFLQPSDLLIRSSTADLSSSSLLRQLQKVYSLKNHNHAKDKQTMFQQPVANNGTAPVTRKYLILVSPYEYVSPRSLHMSPRKTLQQLTRLDTLYSRFRGPSFWNSSGVVPLENLFSRAIMNTSLCIEGRIPGHNPISYR